MCHRHHCCHTESNEIDTHSTRLHSQCSVVIKYNGTKRRRKKNWLNIISITAIRFGFESEACVLLYLTVEQKRQASHSATSFKKAAHIWWPIQHTVIIVVFAVSITRKKGQNNLQHFFGKKVNKHIDNQHIKRWCAIFFFKCYRNSRFSRVHPFQL